MRPLSFVPVTLEGAYVLLEPLSLKHLHDLKATVLEGELWRTWYTTIPSPDTMEAEINSRLLRQEQQTMIPFAVINQSTKKAVGMTSFVNIDPENVRVEVGYTWYAQSVQRSALNTEAKLLLLSHAFEYVHCIAVELRTHFFNQQSRRAIERLGAKLDGILRSHSRSAEGVLRDTCVYSIIESEWPAVRQGLKWQLIKYQL